MWRYPLGSGAKRTQTSPTFAPRRSTSGPEVLSFESCTSSFRLGAGDFPIPRFPT
uniref:Glutamyl-tRNA synthetase, cytoplasmic n=1 Tax=Arundo donax TaxID=35708 RepID=A0A0A9DHK4_ARUDO